MNNQKILVVGGIHGNEPTGITVATYFSDRKVRGITGLIAHPAAVTRRKRYIETDLNRSFNIAIQTSLEEQLAVSLKSQVLSYDVIIDIHNTRASHTTCAIVTSEPTKLQIALASHFGFSRIVIMPPMGSFISQHSAHAISFEYAHNDVNRLTAKKIIDLIAKLDLKTVAQKNGVILYRRVGSLQKETIRRTGIKPNELQNFKPLTAQQKRFLNLNLSYYYCPIFKKYRLEKTACSIVEKVG